MTYEEYKAAVIAEFPADMSSSYLLKFHTAQDHVLMLGEPPLEERLEIYRRVLRRAYHDLVASGQMAWTAQAVKSMFPNREPATAAPTPEPKP